MGVNTMRPKPSSASNPVVHQRGLFLAQNRHTVYEATITGLGLESHAVSEGD